MLYLKNLTKRFGPQILLQDVDFQINKNERIGLVGRNGYGKSTIARMIIGQDTPDEGEISFPENYRIGTLDQHLEFSHQNILDEVSQVLPETQKHEIYRAEILLSGLGFSTEDFQKSPDQFSGGYQIRIKLAQTLLSEPDLLLLDEPTNYLDILSLRWLEKFLQTWKGEILCISHDQKFLENISTHTAAIHRKKIKKYKGSPQKCFSQIAQEEEIYEKTRKNDERETARQEKFIREFRAGARSAGLVQSRIKMLEKKEKRQALAKIPEIKFNFPEAPFNAHKLFEARNIGFNYPNSHTIIPKFSLEVHPGDRIAIIGKNGKGKTTLLKLLSQNLEQNSGTLKIHPNVKSGYFGQSNVQNLDPEKTIIDELLLGQKISEERARAIAGSLLFSNATAYKKINVLSGGERARVNLGKIFTQETNLLFLDEPTNHLDYESIEALIQALKEYQGAIIFVSHNEKLIQEVADKLVIFDNNQITHFTGKYSDFLSEIGWHEETAEASNLSTSKKQAKSPLDSSELAGDLEGEKPPHKNKLSTKELRRLLTPHKRKLERIEKEITRIETLQKENKSAFDIAYRQGNRLKMDTLGCEYQELQTELLEQMESWEKVGEILEDLTQKHS